MKKIYIITLIFISSLSYSQSITFKELITFKNKPTNIIGQTLRRNGYTYYTTKNKGVQWKANDGSGIIGANGDGLVLFMTYNLELYKKILAEIKTLNYVYDDTFQNESYSNGSNTIYISKVTNSENGKLLYSITIM